MRKFSIIAIAYILVSVGIVHFLLMNEPVIDAEVERQLPIDDEEEEIDPEFLKPKIQMGGRLNWPEEGNFKTLDPMEVGDTTSSRVVRSVYEGLVTFNQDLQVVSRLAEEWEISEDGKTYTFFLRRNVYFHDDPCFPDGKGRKVTADDVVYSFTRLCTKDSRNIWLVKGVLQGAEEYYKASTDGTLETGATVKGVRKVGRYDVEIELNYPFSSFLSRLAMTSMSVYPKEAVEKYDKQFSRHPVGTGPFQMKSFDQDRFAHLVRNPKYWRKDEWGNPLPYLDEVFMQVESTTIQVLNKFELGEYDWVRMPTEKRDSIMTNDSPPALKDKWKQYKLKSSPMLVTQYYGFTMTKPPFKGNKKLRQAINYMIDRDAISKYVMKGLVTPGIYGPLPPGINGFNPDVRGYHYDPGKAKQLLAEAGYPNGVGLEPITLNLNAGGGPNLNVAEAVLDQLGKFGIVLKLEQKSWSEHQELINTEQATFFRYGWVGDYPDPENFLLLFDSEKQAPAGPNSTRYSNPEFDKLFQAALREQDEEKRIALYREAEQIVVDDAPWLFLFYSLNFRMNQPWLMNCEENAMELHFFDQMWIKGKKK